MLLTFSTFETLSFQKSCPLFVYPSFILFSKYKNVLEVCWLILTQHWKNSTNQTKIIIHNKKNKCAACFKVLLACTYTRVMAHGTVANHSLIILGIKRQNICGISFDWRRWKGYLEKYMEVRKCSRAWIDWGHSWPAFDHYYHR